MNLKNIQSALRNRNIDGWLFYDFHNRDQIAYRILGLDSTKLATRRWFYFIPSKGEPKKLVHTVEKFKLDPLPGKKYVYLAWEEQHKLLRKILGRSKKIAMQYSPKNNIPYISIVDAGLYELIRSFGYKIVSSADLVSEFEAFIDEKGYELHIKAGKKIEKIKNEAFDLIGRSVRENLNLKEYDIQQFILKRFAEEGLVTHDAPIVGVNEHPADPHFEPTLENSRVFKKGDTVLIDLWAKLNVPNGIYYDITWVGYIGDKPPAEYEKIFNIVKQARDAAVNFVIERFAKKKICYGWEVDEVCRNVIKKAGYGRYFIHRTGHSIGSEVHGNGANIDNLETKDERQLMPGACFSIEPGIYLEGKMAVRSEINMFIKHNGEPVVTGEIQKEIVLIK
ncbi:MAG: Aminopeptidase YpdF (MP-, MA-, MS-, AP-, NP- specific) [Ignavibacteriae bacterium]|nr:MAG: Aminopeptidase YpdF (MP-, MA-, MS-, AP-, NP- specific) [Ignavibacteriota bacterium]